MCLTSARQVTFDGLVVHVSEAQSVHLVDDVHVVVAEDLAACDLERDVPCELAEQGCIQGGWLFGHQPRCFSPDPLLR